MRTLSGEIRGSVMDSVKVKPEIVLPRCLLYHPESEEECGPKEVKSKIGDRNWGDTELAFSGGTLSCFWDCGKVGSFPVFFIFPQSSSSRCLKGRQPIY